MDKSLLIVAALALALPAAAQLEPAQAELAQALASQAAEALSAQHAGARIAVQLGTIDPRLRLAPCKRVEPYLPAGQRPLGRTRVGLRCTEGTTLWNITLPVTVSLFAPGVVLRQALPAGTRLAAEHLLQAEVDWGSAGGAHDDPAALLGRELARPLAAGAPVLATDLRQRQWFAAGETVQVVARGAGFAVSTDGEALGHGIEGQPVRVRTSLGRTVTGRATADRTVEVLP